MAVRTPRHLAAAGFRLALALALSALAAISIRTVHAGSDDSGLQLAPGTIVRWSDPGTTLCAMGGASWQPMGDTCWYPIDLLAPQGPLVLKREVAGHIQEITVRVGPYAYPVQRLDVAPDMVTPPPAQAERIEREQQRVAALWWSHRPRRFSLPLAPPLDPLPEVGGFGSRRIFNGEPRSPHSGTDVAAPRGTTVHAAATGTVVLADDLYFSGNSVFIDHGDQLITMYFHLADIVVAPGAEVARGDPVGTVGATGRATGPHLHFGIRWRGARVDPSLLLENPSSVPRIQGLSPN